MFTWDSAKRRYVPDEDLPMTTFGPLSVPPDSAWQPEPDVRLADNDNLPLVADATRRKGDWMQLYSGRQFWPMDPRADEVEITDIAHSLAMQCRYAGHCLRFYSAAEHSVRVARYVAAMHASVDTVLWALLHDASEAYLVDVPRPVKPYLAGYKDAERAVMAAVCDRFGLPHEMPGIVHEIDGRIIADERANMAVCVQPWASTGAPINARLEYWIPEQAEREFLATFEMLQNMRGAAAAVEYPEQDRAASKADRDYQAMKEVAA